jgi:hypothetical protein
MISSFFARPPPVCPAWGEGRTSLVGEISVPRVRPDCSCSVFSTKLDIVVHDFAHQLFDQLLADHGISAIYFRDDHCDGDNRAVSRFNAAPLLCVTICHELKHSHQIITSEHGGTDRLLLLTLDPRFSHTFRARPPPACPAWGEGRTSLVGEISVPRVRPDCSCSVFSTILRVFRFEFSGLLRTIRRRACHRHHLPRIK